MSVLVLVASGLVVAGVAKVRAEAAANAYTNPVGEVLVGGREP